ncbi:unnamed protein product [Plutella xylostella]|uniref:(diamondback moth) hypothetical protein n=1 Tax=Plutella xylostella TaxID=51655 RepID=A0A8S4DP75_PLUXY|nr:unnamed protein product [Plutella xylostella]
MKRGMAPVPAHLNKKGYFFKRDPRLKIAGLAMMSIETALAYASKKWERLDYYLDVVNKLKETADVTYHEVEGTHHVQLDAPMNIVHLIEEFLEQY